MRHVTSPGLLGRRLSIGLLLAGFAGAAASQPTPPVGFPLTEVAEGDFVHFGQVAMTAPGNRGDIANLGVIVGRDAVAVIDTGGSLAVGRDLRAAIGSLTDKPIRYVINTHEHPDHMFGNAAFDGGAVFVGHHNLPTQLAQRGSYYLRSYREALGSDAIATVRIVPPTLLVDQARVLDLGARSIRLLAWGPAHTDCDLTVLDESTGVLFAGDLVFLQHVPVLDGSVTGWLALLPQLAAVPARLVVPGHGAVAAAWPQALADEQRYLTTLATDARREIAAGTPIERATPLIARSERERWRLFDDYNARNATAAFSELEWE
jgi:quinoprotein relay system zinc metallohydrolase 2